MYSFTLVLYVHLTLLLGYFLQVIAGGALQLEGSNFDSILGNNELVFINFYADWCRFSNILAPTWDEAADAIHKKFPRGKVILGKVDCDQQSAIASRFHITKYPTLKLLRNGQPVKKEYRGQRSVQAFSDFIEEQLKEPIEFAKELSDIENIGSNKRTIIGYFDSQTAMEYELFRKLSMSLKDDCVFVAGFGFSPNEPVRMVALKDPEAEMHSQRQTIITFRSPFIKEEEEAFQGDITSFDQLSLWATERCIPLVREITFQNAEELTEEGLPFLILFHSKDDEESPRRYTEVVQRELQSEKGNINFLTADGHQFAHPLHHLGKSASDLPLIAIDSFRHMYLFPDYNEMDTPGRLKEFLQDLYSGKLHREFHYGPDPKSEPPTTADNGAPGDTTQEEKKKQPTTPPESTFKKLAPSKNRYTLLKDEL